MFKTALSTAIGGASLGTPKSFVLTNDQAGLQAVIRSLFKNNEQGFSFNPNMLGEMYQEVSLRTKTKVNEPIGTFLPSGSILGPNMLSAPTKVSVVGGASRVGNHTYDISAPQGDLRYVSYYDAVNPNIYKLDFTVLELEGGTMRIDATSNTSDYPIRAAGKYSMYVNYTRSAGIAFARVGTPTRAVVRVEGIRQLIGVQATQGTSAARPILRKHPKTGRRNLVANSTLSTANGWKLAGTFTTVSGVTCPACPIAPVVKFATAKANPGVEHVLSLTQQFSRGTKVTLSCYVKPQEVTSFSLGHTEATRTVFNLTRATVSPSGSGTITSVGDGWFRLERTFTMPSNITGQFFFQLMSGSTAVFNGSGAEGVLLCGMQLEIGATASKYQLVTNTNNVTEHGTKDSYIIAYDGVDDVHIVSNPEMKECTVIRSVPGEGTQINFNQFISENHRESVNHTGLVVVNRNLKRKELIDVTRTLDAYAGTSSVASATIDLLGTKKLGLWYDIQDLSTMFQDAVGTIPVTGAGQPVGLLLDKGAFLKYEDDLKGQGNISSNGASPVGSYDPVTGVGVSNRVSSNIQSYLTFKAEPTTTYVLDIENTGLERVINIRPFFAGTILKSIPVGGRMLVYLKGHSSYAITAAVDNSSTPFIVHSMRPLQGVHLVQTTSASRPILGRHPATGARNLVKSNNALNNTSAWSFTGKRTSAQLDSRGGKTATRLYSTSTVPLSTTATVLTAARHTVTFCIKPDTMLECVLGLQNVTKDSMYQTATITRESLSSEPVITGTGWTMTKEANGFYVCCYTTPASTSAGDVLQLYCGSLEETDSTFSLTVDYVQLEEGYVSTKFQRTTSLLDITEDGEADTYYLSFDGVDDHLMSTCTADFSESDSVTIAAGLYKDSNNSIGCVLEHTNTRELYSFGLMAPSVRGSASYGLRNTGNTSLTTTITGALVHTRHVVTAQGTLREGSDLMRRNGRSLSMEHDSLVRVKGTTYLNDYICVGMRAGELLPFIGKLYSLVCVGELAPMHKVQKLEKQLGKLLGVTV